MQILIQVAAIIASYLVGSFSSAIITCHIMGLPDPRKSGSNNPGATNVMRVGGKKAAIITLIGDVLKGFVPIKIICLLGFSYPVLALASVAAFLGHLYPIFFKFKGGKGVATGLGVILALSLPIALIIIGIWLLIFLVFRYSSLAALTACVLGLVYAWDIVSQPVFIALAFITLMLLWRHKDNIGRLIRGEESQFKTK